MELACSVIADNFDYIGLGKRPGFVPFGEVFIELNPHIFKISALDFAAENLVIDGAVNSGRALKLLQSVVTHKADIIRITLHIDLINLYLHRAKLLSFDLLIPNFKHKKSLKSLPFGGGSSMTS